MPGADGVQLQVLLNLIASQTVLDILLIAEDEESRTHEPLLLEQAMKFRLGIVQPHLIGAVDHPDHPISLLKIVPPVRPNRLLPPNIPYIELKTLILQRFNIKPQRRRYLINILSIKFLNNRSLARIIETQHQQSHLFLFLFGLLDDRHEPHFLFTCVIDVLQFQISLQFQFERAIKEYL